MNNKYIEEIAGEWLRSTDSTTQAMVQTLIKQAEQAVLATLENEVEGMELRDFYATTGSLVAKKDILNTINKLKENKYMTNKQYIEERFEEYKHEPHYPVLGGAKVCARCGEQNYETEYCSINIDWTMEELKKTLTTALAERDVEIVEEIEKLRKINDPYDSRGDAVGLSYNQTLADIKALLTKGE